MPNYYPNVRVELSNDLIGNSDFEGRPLVDTIAYLNNILAKVPKEFRNEAMVEIYGDGFAGKVYYYRPKTEEDLINEKEEEDARVIAKRARDRRDYLRLKQQFEP